MDQNNDTIVDTSVTLYEFSRLSCESADLSERVAHVPGFRGDDQAQRGPIQPAMLATTNSAKISVYGRVSNGERAASADKIIQLGNISRRPVISPDDSHEQFGVLCNGLLQFLKCV